MTESNPREPWEVLEDLLEQGGAEELTAYLDGLPAREVARSLSRLPEQDHQRLLARLPAQAGARLVEELSDSQAAELLEELPPREAAAIVDALPSDDQADLLGEMDPEDADAILQEMAPEEVADVRLLSGHGTGTAGALMITEYLAYSEGLRLADVVADLSQNAARYADYYVQYAYAVSAEGALVGVLRLRDLLLTPRETMVSEVMLRDPLQVWTTTPLEELEDLVERHPFLGVPVTDPSGRLVGVVRPAAVEEARGERADRTLLKVSGIVGGEELRSMPLLVRSSRRLSWLSINVALNVIAASVIALYQETLAAAITLAVFLPIISDMSGCSGNQAVAVSLRELTLGLVRPYELLRVMRKEAGVGLINGLALGVLLGGVAYAWKGELWLGLVAGGALALNTVVAVVLGGTIPLALRHFRLDPALASGPILTTVTDMCGFFFALSFASAALSRLSG